MAVQKLTTGSRQFCQFLKVDQAFVEKQCCFTPPCHCDLMCGHIVAISNDRLSMHSWK